MTKQDSVQSSADNHGAPRKSRYRRLPISGMLGAPLQWSPTPDDWRRLETAYSDPPARRLRFDSDLRAEIEKAVEQYLCDAPFEVAAIKSSAKGLAKATRLAKDLGEVVRSLGGEGAIVARHWERYFPHEEEERTHEARTDEDDAALFARIVDTPCKWGGNHRDFRQVVRMIFYALDESLREVARKDAAAFSKGDAWKELVIHLARAFKSRGHKATATKDTNRPLSPFVRFGKELQATFNEKTLRRYPTDSAISEELQKAFKKEVRQLRRYMRDARLRLEISQALSLLKARERREKRCASAANLGAVQAAIAAGRWRKNSQSKDWAGHAVASALKLDAKDKAARSKISALLKTWIKNGMFIVVEGLDDKRERRSYVEVGRPSA